MDDRGKKVDWRQAIEDTLGGDFVPKYGFNPENNLPYLAVVSMQEGMVYLKLLLMTTRYSQERCVQTFQTSCNGTKTSI